MICKSRKHIFPYNRRPKPYQTFELREFTIIGKIPSFYKSFPAAALKCCQILVWRKILPAQQSWVVSRRFFISWCPNGLVQLSQFSSQTLLLWSHDVVIDAVFSIVLIKYARPSPDGSMCYFELWPREESSISGSCSHLVCYLHDRAFGWHRRYLLEGFVNTCSVCIAGWCFSS